MSIEIAFEDLLDKLKSIAELTHNSKTWVSATIGGKEIDPTNRKVQRPAVWASFVGDQIVSRGNPKPCASVIQLNFVVKLLVDYDTDANLTSTHLPLIHTIARAINGMQPTGMYGSWWAYDGAVWESLDPDRMVWNLNFSIQFGL